MTSGLLGDSPGAVNQLSELSVMGGSPHPDSPRPPHTDHRENQAPGGISEGGRARLVAPDGLIMCVVVLIHSGCVMSVVATSE